MSSAQDRFAAFADLVAVSLDDRQVRGAELAARLHLPRFSFGPIISSVCRGDPGPFRRRVLLERAACRR